MTPELAGGPRGSHSRALSLPSAIITKVYAPILILGALGGLVIGGLIHGWGFAG